MIQPYDVTLPIYVNAFCVSVVLRICSMGQKRKTYSVDLSIGMVELTFIIFARRSGC